MPLRLTYDQARELGEKLGVADLDSIDFDVLNERAAEAKALADEAELSRIVAEGRTARAQLAARDAADDRLYEQWARHQGLPVVKRETSSATGEDRLYEELCRTMGMTPRTLD